MANLPLGEVDQPLGKVKRVLLFYFSKVSKVFILAKICAPAEGTGLRRSSADHVELNAGSCIKLVAFIGGGYSLNYCLFPLLTTMVSDHAS